MNDKPNLDLIGMVQRARMEHDAQAQPSHVSAVYWIEVKPQSAGPAPTPRAGYWLIRADLATVDAVWAKIKAATEAGQLGYKSKVATSGYHLPDERMIHVLSYDADDTMDVERICIALYDLGFENLTYQRET